MKGHPAEAAKIGEHTKEGIALNADGSLSVIESFYNLSVNASDPSYVVTVLNSDSNYVTAAAVGTPTAALNTPFPPLAVPDPCASNVQFRCGYFHRGHEHQP